jgi:hypothetical protein
MESVGGNYGQVLEGLGEATDSTRDSKMGGSSPPTEEDDDAERGEAIGLTEGQAQGTRFSTGSRRRSMRGASLDTDHIELANLRNAGGLQRKAGATSHNDY